MEVRSAGLGLTPPDFSVWLHKSTGLTPFCPSVPCPSALRNMCRFLASAFELSKDSLWKNFSQTRVRAHRSL